MTHARATIKWLRLNDAESWPPTGRFSGLVKFVNDTEDWPDTGWTLVAKCLSVEDDGWTWQADIWFIADNAPNHYLAPGNVFDFIEVWDKVGEGVIVSLL